MIQLIFIFIEGISNTQHMNHNNPFKPQSEVATPNIIKLEEDQSKEPQNSMNNAVKNSQMKTMISQNLETFAIQKKTKKSRLIKKPRLKMHNVGEVCQILKEEQSRESDKKESPIDLDESVEMKKNKFRKIRTTITKEKLLQMNKIFSEYMIQKKTGMQPRLNLKNIGVSLGLGYSTILHKYRQFRSTNRVKGGALISSLQKKRKYKKSLIIEQIIQKSLNDRPFYTAVELSKYIQDKYNLHFSRSIISRHLGQMGYSYKNLKASPKKVEECKYKEIRKLFATIMIPLIKKNTQFMYIDELTCSVGKTHSLDENGEKIVVQQFASVIIICTSEGILHYKVVDGFITRQIFYDTMSVFLNTIRNDPNCKTLEGQSNQLSIVLDLNKIHRDDINNMPGILNLFIDYSVEPYYLPPGSPQLNPIEGIFSNIKAELGKYSIGSFEQLWKQLSEIMEKINEEPIMPHFLSSFQWLNKAQNEIDF